MAQTLGCPEPCQVKQWLIALSKHISAPQSSIKFSAHCRQIPPNGSHTRSTGRPGPRGPQPLIKILINIDRDMHGNQLLQAERCEHDELHVSQVFRTGWVQEIRHVPELKGAVCQNCLNSRATYWLTAELSTTLVYNALVWKQVQICWIESEHLYF